MVGTIKPGGGALQNAATEEATVVGDAQTLAATDLGALQAFQAEMQDGSISLTQFLADMATLQTALGDPDRQAAVGSIISAYQQNVAGAIDTLVSEANAAAGN